MLKLYDLIGPDSPRRPVIDPVALEFLRPGLAQCVHLPLGMPRPKGKPWPYLCTNEAGQTMLMLVWSDGRDLAMCPMIDAPPLELA